MSLSMAARPLRPPVAGKLWQALPLRILLALGLLVLAAFALPSSTEAASFHEVKKLTASDARFDDWFGYSVALSGDTAVVGAWREDAGGNSAGAVYVFQRNQGGAGNWGEVKKLIASDAQSGDEYGVSVAVGGDTVVVGADHEDAGGTNAGAVYVFQRNEGGADNWGEVKKLTASDAHAEDRFGRSVAVSGDTAVVGAWREDAGGSNAGASYVFGRDEGGAGNWGEVKKLTASDAATGAGFGVSVAVSGDTGVVGANDGEAAYVFQRDEGGADNWGEVKKLTASDAAANDLFGTSVAVSGDTAVVGAGLEDAGGSGAGAAYVFGRDEGGADNWGEVKKLTASDAGATDEFGISVAVSVDTAVVGAWREDAGGFAAGAAYVFQRDEGGADNWGEVKKLTASDAQAFDFLGASVTVGGDTAVVGAFGQDAGGSEAGAGYVFDLLGVKSTPTSTPTDTPTSTPCPPAGCPTPTHTPTATATATPGSPEMLLTIKAGDCDDPSRPTTCDVPAGAKFQLSVEALVVPATGYTGIQTYIDFGSDLIYDVNAISAADEVVWPECEGVVAIKGQPVAKLNDLGTPIIDNSTVPARPLVNTSSEVVAHGCLSGLIPPQPVSFYTGNIVELSLTCSNAITTTEVILRPLGDPLTAMSGSGFTYLDPVTNVQTNTTPKVNSLTINCVEPPSPVGGVSIGDELAALPLEASGGSGGSYGVGAMSIAIAAAVVLSFGIGWYVTRRRLR